MPRKNRRRLHEPRPLLYLAQILAWADEHRRRTGAWPTRNSGPILGTVDEKWCNVNMALFWGRRGLRPGSSVARLLAEHRGVRNFKALPAFTIEQILSWADAYYQRTGAWPRRRSGPIPESSGETWLAVESALRDGVRGLPGGSSLPELLKTRRGVRNLQSLPPLRVKHILAWADAYHRRTGRWPKMGSGPIEDAPGETWLAVDAMLRRGGRSLRGGSSLSQLLAERRGVRNSAALPRLTYDRILKWADAHHRRTRTWPRVASGAVFGAPGETWGAINTALMLGRRGLPPGLTLARLLQGHGKTDY